MSAATLATKPQTMSQAPHDIFQNLAQHPELAEEVRIGLDRLRRMSHDELRSVITNRVALLQNVLKEREARRAALETAQTASRILDLRRERTLRLSRQINVGSVLAAVASTVLLFVAFV